MIVAADELGWSIGIEWTHFDALWFTEEAWSPDPEINNGRLVEESPVKREVSDVAVLHSQVSRVLEFGDEKEEDEDDDKKILPVEPPRQMSILIVVWLSFLPLHTLGGKGFFISVFSSISGRLRAQPQGDREDNRKREDGQAEGRPPVGGRRRNHSCGDAAARAVRGAQYRLRSHGLRHGECVVSNKCRWAI